LLIATGGGAEAEIGGEEPPHREENADGNPSNSGAQPAQQ